jgi:hypothetical protein
MKYTDLLLLFPIGRSQASYSFKAFQRGHYLNQFRDKWGSHGSLYENYENRPKLRYANFRKRDEVEEDINTACVCVPHNSSQLGTPSMEISM